MGTAHLGQGGLFGVYHSSGERRILYRVYHLNRLSFLTRFSLYLFFVSPPLFDFQVAGIRTHLRRRGDGWCSSAGCGDGGGLSALRQVQGGLVPSASTSRRRRCSRTTQSSPIDLASSSNSADAYYPPPPSSATNLLGLL